MKHMENLLAAALGISTLLGSVMVGCTADPPPPDASSGSGASSAGGDGSGGNPTGSASGGSGGMMAGSGGAGGTSTGGSGGMGGCSNAADCTDGFNCTVDTCNAGICEHAVGPNSGATACPAGKTCQLGLGCVDIIICADDAQCIDKLGTDPCKANIRCNPATSVCEYTPLDKDNDGESPLVCGGKDCDDSKSQTYPGATEQCDGKDNNCNGTADENAMCPGLAMCQAGACTCAPANACGTDCVDKMTNNSHCGTCNNACLGISTCMNGTCVCPGGATSCGALCVDTKTDPQHCGGCGKACPSGYSCANGFCTCLGTPCGSACVDTANDPLHCGGCNNVCPFTSTCQNSMCVCPMGQMSCNGQCVNTMTSVNHCGGCNVVCPLGGLCQNGNCMCPIGQTSCNGQCVNTMTNASHCGGCNKPCNGTCQNGTCMQCTFANLYFLNDVSGSMGGNIALGGTKIDAMRSAINSFISDALSANMGVGLGRHPISSSCVDATYMNPDVPIAMLPGNRMAMANALAAQVATGSSTPPPGLRGALQYAQNYAITNSTQKAAVVYFLDGMPGICATTTGLPDELVLIAQQFANSTPKVVTYVIGLSDGTAPTQTQVNQIAAAGGTGTGVLAASATDVLNALNNIRAQFKTCP